MKIRCIAIDDEPLALKQIGAYLERTPFFETITLCSSAFEALQYVREGQVDLLWVDINMPDLNGMDFVKSLGKKIPVIFTTAYSEYAIEGFQVDALDYLLKPISYASFLKSANKAKAWFDMNNKSTEAAQPQADSYPLDRNQIHRRFQRIHHNPSFKGEALDHTDEDEKYRVDASRKYVYAGASFLYR
jgi:two-component system LytT family response regulator